MMVKFYVRSLSVDNDRFHLLAVNLHAKYLRSTNNDIHLKIGRVSQSARKPLLYYSICFNNAITLTNFLLIFTMRVHNIDKGGVLWLAFEVVERQYGNI